ncbi:MAG: hypothetical protein ABSB35_22235 [Bryobacteraceae bacterium]|jgi:hypothetical protein
MDLGDRLRLFELVYSRVKKRIIEAARRKPKSGLDDASGGQPNREGQDPEVRADSPPLKMDD